MKVLAKSSTDGLIHAGTNKSNHSEAIPSSDYHIPLCFSPCLYLSLMTQAHFLLFVKLLRCSCSMISFLLTCGTVLISTSHYSFFLFAWLPLYS